MKLRCQTPYCDYKGLLSALAVTCLLTTGVSQAAEWQIADLGAKGYHDPYRSGSVFTSGVSVGIIAQATVDPLAQTALPSDVSTFNPPVYLADSGIAGMPMTATPSHNNSGGDRDQRFSTQPSVHLAQSVGDDFWLGFGLSTPLVSSAEAPHYAFLRSDGMDTSLHVTSLAPRFGWKINERWSVDAGLELQRGEAHLSYSLSESDIANSSYVTEERLSRIRAESWESGFNLGMNLSLSEQTRLGWHYRSAVSHSFKGVATIVEPYNTGNSISQYEARADMNLPAVSSLAFSHQADPRWTLQGQYTWFEWSNFDGLHFSSDEAGDISHGMGYRDSWSLSLGSEFRYDPQWTLRGGVQYDQTPAPNVVGDSARLALGAAYRSNDRLSVEMAYTHVLIQQQSLAIDSAQSSTDPLGSSMMLRGNGTGHVFGLGLRYAF